MKPALLARTAARSRTRPPRFAMRGAIRRLGLVLATLALLWTAGLAWFVHKVMAERPPAPLPHADGIVVLTGGADRVHAGLALLAARTAPRLLISGAGAGTSITDFTPRDGIDARAEAAHITLGHAAHTTRGNARETANWVASHRLRSLIVVTADYHMPRALLELHRQLPYIRFYPDPVRPPSMAHPAHAQMLRLLAGEFSKYLLVRLRIGGFAARHLEFLVESAPANAAAKARSS